MLLYSEQLHSNKKKPPNYLYNVMSNWNVARSCKDYFGKKKIEILDGYEYRSITYGMSAKWHNFQSYNLKTGETLIIQEKKKKLDVFFLLPSDAWFQSLCAVTFPIGCSVGRQVRARQCWSPLLAEPELAFC